MVDTRNSRWLPMFQAAFTKFQHDSCLQLGAAMAYYALFSLFPLLLLILTVIGFFVGPDSGAREQILTAVPEQAADQIAEILDQLSANKTGAGLVGFVTLLLGASGVFGVLDQTFNTIWDVKPDETNNGLVRSALSFMLGKLVSFALVLGTAFLLLASIIVSTTITVLSAYTESLPGSAILWQSAQFGGSLAIVMLALALLFKFLPDTRVGWGDVWLGALISALLFNVLQKVIGIYLGSTNYSSYGAVGSVMALLVWIYFTSLVLFLGAEISHAYANYLGSRARLPATTSSANAPVATAQPTQADAPQPAPSAQAVAAASIGAMAGVVGTLTLLTATLVIGIRRSLQLLRGR